MHSVSDTISFPYSGCFSPFPHGTCSLSVISEYLALEGGPPMFKRDFTCPALLENIILNLCVQGYHLFLPSFPECSAFQNNAYGLVRVRSSLLAESLFDFFSYGYLDISVHRVSFLNLCIQFRIGLLAWVFPFGDLRIKGYSYLPGAFRKVLRPSSPADAKAFTKCT